MRQLAGKGYVMHIVENQFGVNPTCEPPQVEGDPKSLLLDVTSGKHLRLKSKPLLITHNKEYHEW